MTDERAQNSESELEFEDTESLSSSTVSKLKKALKKCKEENKELLDGWQRSRADFANLQKSNEDLFKRARSNALRDFIGDFISVMDSFDVAFANKEAWESIDKNWRTGVEYIYSQAKTVLTNHGIESYAEVGDNFDPNFHHSSKVVDTENESEDGKIVGVLQKGYKLEGEVIRPANVLVAHYKKD